MLLTNTAPIALPEVSPAALARALRGVAPGSDIVVLAPCDSTGWFDGTCLACCEPEEAHDRVTPAEAAEVLSRVERGSETRLAAAVVTYEGAASVRVFEGGLAMAADGWRVWGEAPWAAEALSAASSLGGADRTVAPDTTAATHAPLLADPVRGMEREEYEAAVEETREWIAAGNVYVANITYRVNGRPLAPPIEAFDALTRRASAPMSALLVTRDSALASISPERFVGVRRGDDGARIAEVWPIKGTRPRGSDPESDRRLADELAADLKERAEHVMIVDLERNDLGRVCVPGTVRVDPLTDVFPTPYCHQMVSRVFGELNYSTDIGDLMSATFPCGSVTGAPKIAAMKLIERLERSPRGAYCGTLAVAVPGRLDSSVLIRTLEYVEEGSARWGTGCGITYDSDAGAEWDESVLKTWPVLGR
ncbi:MAG: anthranilate synthase component I family protein [Coriobacteriia bacterium]|nr:anthranilate synthase component I family protein [Coriobacteriia bacterium]